MSALDLHRHRWEPATSPGLPTLLLLHGTGGDEHDLVPLAQLLLPGAALLSVRGNVLEQGASRFFRRLAEGVFDLDDLRQRTEELAEFIAAATARYGVAAYSLHAVGFSNGANVAASLMLSRPGVLTGGVLLRAMVPFERDPAPELTGCAVLLSEGRLDPIIAPSEGQRLAGLLRAAGADVELVWQEGGHTLTNGDVTAAQRWLTARARAGTAG